jgi:hypothetical protein
MEWTVFIIILRTKNTISRSSLYDCLLTSRQLFFSDSNSPQNRSPWKDCNPSSHSSSNFSRWTIPADQSRQRIPSFCSRIEHRSCFNLSSPDRSLENKNPSHFTTATMLMSRLSAKSRTMRNGAQYDIMIYFCLTFKSFHSYPRDSPDEFSRDIMESNAITNE